jgi:ribosomal protein S27AE
MNGFALVSDVDAFLFENFGSMEDNFEMIDISSCPNCHVHMSVRTNQYICERCGFMRENVEVADHTSNISDNNYSVMATGIRCIGNNAYKYQSILRSNCNSTESNRETLLSNVLFGNSRIGKNISIPKEVLLSVADQYRHIGQSGNVARGTIFRAILAALTYYECLKRRYSFKPVDIYTWFDIDPCTYSKGDKKVRELLDYGLLDVDLREIQVEESYAYKYATSLNFTTEQIAFIIELLQFVIKNNLINPNAKSSTRALAVINFFITASKINMNTHAFEEHFNCNFGSVRTLCLDMAERFEQVRHLFIKYNIPYDGVEYHTKKAIKRKVKKGSRIAL